MQWSKIKQKMIIVWQEDMHLEGRIPPGATSPQEGWARQHRSQDILFFQGHPIPDERAPPEQVQGVQG